MQNLFFYLTINLHSGRMFLHTAPPLIIALTAKAGSLGTNRYVLPKVSGEMHCTTPAKGWRCLPSSADHLPDTMQMPPMPPIPHPAIWRCILAEDDEKPVDQLAPGPPHLGYGTWSLTSN